jgi:molybdopterin synthase catalytic subunit
MILKKAIIQKEEIDASKLITQIGTESDGAVVTFIGRARNLSEGRNVEYLDYEIYNGMALKELEKIIGEASSRWPLNCCLVVHRYGRIAVGELSIFIAVSSPHREESFDSSRYIIDEIKRRVPIWKKEYFAGGSEWAAK